MAGRVGTTRMKLLALGFPAGPLRDDILSQPDELSLEEFLASARMWLRLARSR